MIDLASRAHMTSQTDTILLTSMFALCLRVDDYATDTQLMATDLKLGVTRSVFSWAYAAVYLFSMIE